MENRLRLPVDLAWTYADCAVVGSCCHCLRFRSYDEDLGHDEYQYGCTQLSLDAAHPDLEQRLGLVCSCDSTVDS